MRKMFIKFNLIGILFVTLSACSQTPDFESYDGSELNIGVIGEAPAVNEEQVYFDEISFDVLNGEIDHGYDAIFVMPENLKKASEIQYADIFSTTETPVFFISAKSHIPFTIAETTYSDQWQWSPGNSYSVGVVKQENDLFRSIGYGLYNEKETKENINEMYSRIFEKVEDI
ncbi:hypothetical protein E2491_12910 [Jeotgalibacillus sp. R-1-5s-1]|nr:hypothetical protein E2491_12910 [Jeotgalibacillus sp. R-1-5s-1]